MWIHASFRQSRWGITALWLNTWKKWLSPYNAKCSLWTSHSQIWEEQDSVDLIQPAYVEHHKFVLFLFNYKIKLEEVFNEHMLIYIYIRFYYSCSNSDSAVSCLKFSYLFVCTSDSFLYQFCWKGRDKESRSHRDWFPFSVFISDRIEGLRLVWTWLIEWHVVQTLPGCELL